MVLVKYAQRWRVLVWSENRWSRVWVDPSVENSWVFRHVLTESRWFLSWIVHAANRRLGGGKLVADSKWEGED